MLKKFAKSKTIVFNIALIVFGVIETNQGQLQTLLTPENYGYAVMAIGIIGGILRFYTIKPIQEK